MRTVLALMNRNRKLFFKDKGMLFTSMITPVILIVLYATFLAKVFRDSFTAAIPDVITISDKLINGTVAAQLTASLMAVSCITVTFCVNLTMVQDKANGTWKDFNVSPVSKGKIYLGYFLSTVANSLMVNTLAFVLCLGYLLKMGWYLNDYVVKPFSIKVGFHFYQEMGGNTILSFFRPWILLISVLFVNGILWIASEGVIRKITTLSCVESATYDGNKLNRKIKHPVEMVLKRSEIGEMFYIAWGNITRHKARFIITSISIFLGVLSFILMNVLTNGCDYKHLLEKRPDFLLAGEFSEFGKSQGCGEEYKTREIDVDPLLTQGDGVELLYDNDYDEFSPISQELEKKLHKIDGIDWENSNLIEGAYVTTVMSKKGIRPYDEGLSDLTNDNMVEGFSWDTVQVLNENQILSLKKYVQDNQLNIDVKSLEEGNGVLIIHDHMLTPEQQKLADEAIGEPVYFKTLLSREDAIRRKEQSNSENKEKQQEDEFPQKESETFTLCGYLDRQSDDFPEIHQSWHGREGSLYYFISEKGFQKIPTEKKILAMELTADPEKEPYVKTQISELISEENKKRSEMTEVSMDEGTGEAGVFVICKSDLMQQKETYMRGNRILLGAISIILFIAGLTNYCNVVFTGMYARRKEFDIMKSIGMTDKQMKLMLFGEGSYYFMCVVGLLFTVGMAVVFGVKIYMENKLSYFTFYWPIHITVGVIVSLLLINIAVTHFICKKR